MGLGSMGEQDPVEAALRPNKQIPISQHWDDLARRQFRKLRLVAGQQDEVALLVVEAVSNASLAAFSAIGAIPSTCEQSPTAPHGCEAHPAAWFHF